MLAACDLGSIPCLPAALLPCFQPFLMRGKCRSEVMLKFSHVRGV